MKNISNRKAKFKYENFDHCLKKKIFELIINLVLFLSLKCDIYEFGTLWSITTELPLPYNVLSNYNIKVINKISAFSIKLRNC